MPTSHHRRDIINSLRWNERVKDDFQLSPRVFYGVWGEVGNFLDFCEIFCTLQKEKRGWPAIFPLHTIYSLTTDDKTEFKIKNARICEVFPFALHDDDDYGNELSQKHGQNYFLRFMCVDEKEKGGRWKEEETSRGEISIFRVLRSGQSVVDGIMFEIICYGGWKLDESN